MKKAILPLGQLFLLFTLNQVFSQTIISGSDLSSSVWTNQNSPYIVNGDVSFASTSTLIIQAGVIVKFNKGASMKFYDEENFIALGTEEERILFTSNEENPRTG